MFKGLGNMAALFKQAQEFQGRMNDVQAQLAQLKVTGTAGGGMVHVEASGQQKILSCRIEESLLAGGDREMVEDLVVAATNQALDKAREAAAAEMSKVAGGMNLPGLGDALSSMGLGGGGAGAS